jgi:hypothetical protein
LPKKSSISGQLVVAPTRLVVDARTHRHHVLRLLAELVALQVEDAVVEAYEVRLLVECPLEVLVVELGALPS